jgi:hypothetical protein
MLPTKQSKRYTRIKRSPPFSERLAELRLRLDRSLQAYRRQQRLRRMRKRVNPAGEQQLLALRKSLEFRWLQRWLQRRQQSQQSSWNLTAWLWPPTGTGLDTGHAAALLLRKSAAVLLLLILISLVLNALPLNLRSPNWYLQVIAYIAENVPVLLLASGFSILSLFIGASHESITTYRSKLLRTSRLGYIFFLALLPIQLGFTVWLFGQAFSANRIQTAAFRATADALVSGAQQTSSSEQFIAYLRSRNLTANLESIAAAPLAQVKSEFIRSVKLNLQQQEQNLNADVRTTLFRYTIDSVKLFTTLLLFTLFMRFFQHLVRRSMLESPSPE